MAGHTAQEFETLHPQALRGRTSESEALEGFKVKGTKRKASKTGDRPHKRRRICELDERDEGTTSSKETAEPKRTSESEALEGFKVKGTKRKASETLERPHKRQRICELDKRDEGTSSSKETAEPKRTSESEALEGFKVKGTKRKASETLERLHKRQRICELDERGEGTTSSKETAEPKRTPESEALEGFKVKGTKRKASETGDRPHKRRRICELDKRDEGTSSSKETAEPKKSSTEESSSVKASRQEFESKYRQLNAVGKGGQGSVYAGYTRADNFPVAIKHIPRDNVLCRNISRKTRLPPLEVAVMIRLARAPSSAEKSAAIALLDYYDLDEELILILERPDPCTDLVKYIDDKGRSLHEEEARLILKQLVEATVELEEKNIFHRDIKLENILMETSTDVPRLRLIDFGLSCFTKKTSVYTVFCGTVEYIPPEWYQRHTYSAGPSTVWQVGVVLYEMLHSHNQFETRKFLRNRVKISQELSQDCQDILRQCLAVDPWLRPSLEQLRLHPWLK